MIIKWIIPYLAHKGKKKGGISPDCTTSGFWQPLDFEKAGCKNPCAQSNAPRRQNTRSHLMDRITQKVDILHAMAGEHNRLPFFSFRESSKSRISSTPWLFKPFIGSPIKFSLFP
jgi:hypothetical protein